MRQMNLVSLPHTLLGAAVALIGGCAATPAVEQSATKAPAELYAGQPATVHATEFPVTSVAEGVQRGDAAWQQGNLDLALYLYLQALQFDANDAAPLRKIGAIHESRGNTPLARKAFEMALERGGEHAGTLERLGLIYLQEERVQEASALLTRAIKLDPRRWRAHNGLGVLADGRREYAAAQSHYDAALSIEPKAGIAYNNRGYSKYLAGDLAGAEQDFYGAIRLGAGDQALLNLGRVQAKSRRYSAAFKTLLDAFDTAHAYNEVGEVAMLNGDHHIAKAYFENATNASPAYFEKAYKNLASANEALLSPRGGS